MKLPVTILLINSAFVVGAGIMLAFQLFAHKQPSPTMRTLADGKKEITNKQYHFAITRPQGMSIDEYPVLGPELMTLIFKRSNPNTNEGKTRDTMNRFNTAADDAAFFSVYEKPALWDKSDLDTFTSWFNKNVQPYRHLVRVALQTQESQPVFVTSESDGVAGSTGRYEYLVGK